MEGADKMLEWILWKDKLGRRRRTELDWGTGSKKQGLGGWYVKRERRKGEER